MPDLLIRDLDPELMERLKRRAKANSRSVQAEVKEILKKSAPLSWQQFRAEVEALQPSLTRRRPSNSAELIRGDRER
jgi:antitoxin FitA